MTSAAYPAGASARVFLFLQGPASPLFMRIAERLEAGGARCLRINLNIGDRIFWRRTGGFNYRGRRDRWPDYIRAFMARHAVTDLVLMGEERDYHRVATEAAKRSGIAVSVVEMGYLRPDWVTIERDGISTNSHFPNDPAFILAAAEGLPEPDWTARYTQTFLAEAVYDLLYNLPNVFLWFLYPHYKRHALFHPLAEYAGWLHRLMTGKARKAAAAIAGVEALVSRKIPFFLFPLQLQTDFQLRIHSPYLRQEDAIREVLESFATHAPPETHLVLKLHPLDNGLTDWQGCISALCLRLHLSGRVHLIDGGDLNRLADAAKGMVTVNSTSALHGLRRGMAAKTLGVAIYDIEGLTDQRPLDAFWVDPQHPDPHLCDAFYRLVAASIQVRGNFSSTAGTIAAGHAIADRLLDGRLNEPGGYVAVPPRVRPQKKIFREVGAGDA